MKKIILILIIIPILLQAKPQKLIRDSGIVETEITINDTITARVGIDTGADRFYLSKSFAEENGIEISRAPGQKDVQTNYGSAKPFDAYLESVKLSDDITLYGVNVTAIDFDNIVKNRNEDLVGLIGNKILKDYFVTVDYNNDLIEITESKPYDAINSNCIEVPFTWYQDHMIVSVTIGDRYTFDMLFDFCASYTVISDDVIGHLGGDVKKNRMVKLKKVSLGMITNVDVSTQVYNIDNIQNRLPNAGIEGIIGMSFLKNYKITIDYNAQIIYFYK